MNWAARREGDSGLADARKPDQTKSAVSRFRRKIRAALRITFLAIVAAGTLSACVKPDRAKNLVRNGDLSCGSDGLPLHWSPDRSASSSILRWNPPGAEPGELEIENLVPAAARWDQLLILRPGWYRVALDVRTYQVSQRPVRHRIATIEPVLAGIALLQSSGRSATLAQVSGTSPWTHLEFYLREHQWGGTLEISCELGPAVGHAWFRNIEVLSIAAPTADEPVIDLEPLGPARMPPLLSPPTGNLLGVGCGLLLLLLLGWGTSRVMATRVE